MKGFRNLELLDHDTLTFPDIIQHHVFAVAACEQARTIRGVRQAVVRLPRSVIGRRHTIVDFTTARYILPAIDDIILLALLDIEERNLTIERRNSDFFPVRAEGQGQDVRVQ